MVGNRENYDTATSKARGWCVYPRFLNLSSRLPSTFNPVNSISFFSYVHSLVQFNFENSDSDILTPGFMIIFPTVSLILSRRDICWYWGHSWHSKRTRLSSTTPFGWWQKLQNFQRLGTGFVYLLRESTANGWSAARSCTTCWHA